MAELKKTIKSQSAELAKRRKRLADEDRPAPYNRPGEGLIENPGFAANQRKVEALRKEVHDLEKVIRNLRLQVLRHTEALRYISKTAREEEPADSKQNTARSREITQAYEQIIDGDKDKELKLDQRVQKEEEQVRKKERSQKSRKKKR